VFLINKINQNKKYLTKKRFITLKKKRYLTLIYATLQSLRPTEKAA